MSGDQVDIVTNIKKNAELRNVPFVVIGGQAVMAYSAFRVTFDLDLCVRKRDLEIWRELCMSLGYTVFHEQAAFIQFQGSVSGPFPLDVMLANEQTFDQLRSSAVEKGIAGVTLKVASPDHLIAMKLHALKNSGSDRERTDLLDILELIAVGKISTQTFKALCDRFGSEELYGKIKRHIR